jgi:hypothetical protein
MNFKNAYELNSFLFEKGLLEGIHIGIRGEFEVITTIKDEKILKILKEIWGDWMWGATEGEANATYGGFYNLYIDSNNLEMSNSIDDDILDFDGNPFDIEKILVIISDYLLLDNIDKEEFLEYQICLDIEMEYENLEESFFYDISDFKIKSFEKNDDLSKELLTKLTEHDIEKIKLLLLEYLIKVHNDNHSYKGFSLRIQENNISNYNGTGFEKITSIKTFMENQLIDIDLSLLNIKITNS